MIARLVVAPACMRRGIGRALARHAITLAGDRAVLVGTAAANCPALELYTGLGFQRVGERTVGDAIVYVTLRRPGGLLHVRPWTDVCDAAEEACERHRGRVLAALPTAHVEHVGSTAIPGAWTKGDVDLLVGVAAFDFDAAVAALRGIYRVHQPENWSPTYASFVDPEARQPAAGVQLVVAGSADDAMFRRFRDALTADPALLAEYNALKHRHDGGDRDAYAAAKEGFVTRVLDAGGRSRA